MRARVVSRELLTETYSPSAIEIAPPTRPARPAVAMAGRFGVAPATPTTMAATETMPSLAPSTPARSQFRRLATPAPCGSSWFSAGAVGGVDGALMDATQSPASRSRQRGQAHLSGAGAG